MFSSMVINRDIKQNPFFVKVIFKTEDGVFVTATQFSVDNSCMIKLSGEKSGGYTVFTGDIRFNVLNKK